MSTNNVVRFFDFSRFHGKVPPAGSTHIRVEQLVKYWDEADKYKYGEKVDVMIYQKVYYTPDYRFMDNFKGIQILDICDPDWLEQAPIVETCNAMDVIVVPTQALKDFIEQFHSSVHVIKDRFDLELIPESKRHKGKAKTVVWFGYSHNAENLKPAIRLIEELGLNLIVISNDDPIANRWGLRDVKDYYTYIKYNEETIYHDLQRADFCVLPEGVRPVDRFKSENKTIKANLAGLPVAHDADEVRLYMSENERRKWFTENYDIIKEEYDVRKSVEEYKEIIDAIKTKLH